jgi:hypothetical protein
MPYFTCFGILRMPYFTSFRVLRMPYFNKSCPSGKPPFDHEEITVSRRCYKAVKDQLEIL